MTRANEINEKLTQYQSYDNTYRVAHETEDRLPPGTYKMKADMAGIFFERVSIVTDKILKATDERLDGIIEEAASFWGLKEKYNKMGITHKRGILLESKPGTGKSVLMQRLSEDAVKKGGVVITSTDPRLLVRGLHQIRKVESDRNIMVLIDDADRFVSYGESALLGLLDGEDTVTNVLYVAATNYVEKFSPRLRRPGRFDTLVSVKNPPASVREAYFKDKLPDESDEHIAKLVKATNDFSFAALREMLVSTSIYDRDVNAEAERIRKSTDANMKTESLHESRFQKIREAGIK